jgi:hypothetical protein
MSMTTATSSGTNLRIFDAFPVAPTDGTISIGTVGSNDWITVDRGATLTVNNPDITSWSVDHKSSRKWSFKFLSKIIPELKKMIPKPMSIQQFFYQVINSSVDLKKLDSRIKNYENMIEKAKKDGQEALKDLLLERVEEIRKESLLYAAGVKKVITEDQLLTFKEKARNSENLNLVWIKNYVRVIPPNVLKKKEKYDKLEIFDDYAILFYEKHGKYPKKRAVAKTKKEIEKERDPILFGVRKNIRKLYFVGDWKDKYCDLTLDDIVKKLGKKEVSKNDLTAKIKVKTNND